MAAGLGFKDFTTGEVLTAADVDGYLMQGVWVFASATARDAAVTSPQEGNFAFLKDTNTTTYYTGSAWTNLDTTGMVNPMTTTGDTIYSSSGSTPARLGIGTAGQVLRVNSGATAPEWATPAASGGITLIQESVASANSAIDFTSISGSYKNLVLQWQGIYHSAGLNGFDLRFNSDSGSNYKNKKGFIQNTSAFAQIGNNTQAGSEAFGYNSTSSTLQNTGMGILTIYNYASTSKYKQYSINYAYTDTTPTTTYFNIQGTWASTSAITEVNIYRSAGAGTFSNAADTSIRLYGEA